MMYFVLVIAVICSGFLFTGTALTALLLLVWTVLVMRQTFMAGRWTRYPLSGWMLVYLVWLVVTAWWSDIPGVSWLAAWVLACLPLSYLAWGMTPNSDTVWAGIRTALLLAGPALALWGLWQVVTGYGFGYPVGPLLDKNAFAALMNVFWFVSCVHFMGKFGDRALRWRMILMALGLLVIAMTLFASESRGAILTWLVLTPFALWAGYRETRSKNVLVVVLAIILTGYLGAANLLGLSVGNRTLSPMHDASTSARILLWKSTAQIARDHPITGTGWGTFAAEYPAYRDPSEYSTGGLYTHNDYLQLAAEGGVPALLLLLGILAGLLLHFKRSLALPQSTHVLEATGLLLAVLALFLHASLNFIFCFAFMNILAGLLAARAIQLLNPARVGYVSLGNGLAKLARGTKVIMTGFLLLLLAGPLVVELMAQTMLTGSQSGLVLLRTVWPTATSYQMAKLITAIQPHSIVAQQVMLRISEDALKESNGISVVGVNLQKELLEETLDRYEIARNQALNRPDYGVLEARLLIQYRNFLESGVALKRAREILMQNLRIDPFHADSMITLSRLDVIEGHPLQAQQFLAASMQHVLVRWDQQLLAVEVLRQRAAPRQVVELNTIEKQLRKVRSDSRAGKAFILPANFNENIDIRLTQIARKIGQ